jgi:hypothetical protein
MLAHFRRHALVAGLILAAGLAAVAVGGQSPPAPSVPAIGGLIAQTGWRVVSATAPTGGNLVYRQWLVEDSSRHQALIYVGVTTRVQDMLRWSPELGYLGDGYLVVGRREAIVRVGADRQTPIGEVALRRLNDRRILQFALVGPHGAGREARDLALGAVWDVALGQPATYYALRVSTTPGSAEEAAGAHLLAAALTHLI